MSDSKLAFTFGVDGEIALSTFVEKGEWIPKVSVCCKKTALNKFRASGGRRPSVLWCTFDEAAALWGDSEHAEDLETLFEIGFELCEAEIEVLYGEAVEAEAEAEEEQAEPAAKKGFNRRKAATKTKAKPKAATKPKASTKPKAAPKRQPKAAKPKATIADMAARLRA